MQWNCSAVQWKPSLDSAVGNHAGATMPSTGPGRAAPLGRTSSGHRNYEAGKLSEVRGSVAVKFLTWKRSDRLCTGWSFNEAPSLCSRSLRKSELSSVISEAQGPLFVASEALVGGWGILRSNRDLPYSWCRLSKLVFFPLLNTSWQNGTEPHFFPLENGGETTDKEENLVTNIDKVKAIWPSHLLIL